MKTITKVLPGLLLVAYTALVPATSAASVITRTDGNDTPGALDLGKVRIAHMSRTTDSILVQTISPFTNRDIDGKQGYFVLNFSMDGGSHVQWVGYVFFTEGKLRCVLVNSRGRVAATLRVARAGGRGVIVRAPHEEIGGRSYRVVTFSVWRGPPCTRRCVDSLPNRGSLLHDIVAPTVTPLKFPEWEDLSEFGDAGGGMVTFPVSFSVADDKYGSGIGRWKLQREVGSSWETVATGHAASPTVQATGEQGKTHRFRVVVADRQKNQAISEVRLMSLAVDDNSSSISYDASWTHASDAAWYLSTKSLGAQGGQLSFVFEGDSLGFCLGPTSGPIAQADYLLTPTATGHSSEAGTISASGSTPNGYCTGVNMTDMDTWTLTLNVTSSEPLPIDGFFVLHNH